MDSAPTPRTERLLKVYIGLFALGVVLCGVLLQRHFAASSGRDAVIAAAPREAPTPRNYGPSINWGGAKR